MNTELSGSESQPEVFRPSMLGTHTIFGDTPVLKRIIEFLSIDSKSRRHRLFSAALTCRSFSDPALNVLWESLDSIMPLLKLLSPFKLVSGFCVLQGPFDEEDWRRFDAYSSRVKKLTVLKDCPNVAQSTYIRLAQWRPLLLPALEEFNSTSTLESDTSLLLLLSPTLKRLNIGGDRIVFDKLIGPALSMIAYAYEQGNSYLTHLTLCGQPPPHPSGLVGQFSNLRQLDVSGVIDAQNFRELGELGYLESLTVQLPPSLAFEKEELGFERLRSLHVTSPFPSLLAVFEKIGTVNLESVVIISTPTIEIVEVIRAPTPAPAPPPTPEKVPPRKTAGKRFGASQSRVPPPTPPAPPSAPPPPLPRAFNDWKQLVGIVNSRWSLTLRSITIDQEDVPDTVVIETPPDLFSDLTPFQRLEFLKIKLYKFFPCDEGTHFLALACPNLTMLHLRAKSVVKHSPPNQKTGHRIDWSRPPLSKTNTTIVALWSLCDLCHKLEDLQIGLDVTDLPPFFNTIIRSHRLARLSVSSHRTIEADRSQLLNIARHIDRLFPYLDTVVTYPNYGAKIWDEVKHILSMYKMVRSDDGIRRLTSEEVREDTTRK